MSGSPHRRQANTRPRSYRMAGPPQQAPRQSRLAIHNRQRPRQAEETVPSVRVTRAPSFYRFKLGTIEITVVSDGTLAFPAETLWGDRADDARGLLTSTFQSPNPVGLQLNAILVNTGGKLVMIDAGCGMQGKFQKTAGGLLGSLAAAGYAPGDIDMIV